jgi:hypothetical protein
VFYAGGGGGAVIGNQTTYPAGLGVAGGGNGNNTGVGFSAIANTGSGGGGGGWVAEPGFIGGAGGSGIVVIRYPSYLLPAASTTGSPEMYVAGAWRVYKFVASGTITF